MNKNTTNETILESLFSVGAHFGFVKSRRHPSAKPYIFGAKNKIEIIDLEKTKESLDKALEEVKKIASKKGIILFVGGKNEARDAIEMGANSINQPYVSGRWIGGTLTNFSEIKKRVNKLEQLLSEKEKGELAKYTKKERLLIDKQIEKMKIYFSGLVNLRELPKAIFVVDTKKENIAVKEARDLNIKVIGLCGTDCDLNDSHFPIPANDASKSSIKFFVDSIVSAYKEGMMMKD